MFDINDISALALDVAGSAQSHEKQERLAEVVWSLLDKDYQIFLFSSNQKDDLQAETFQHPRLRFFTQPFPPSDALQSEFPALRSPQTLWVTEDAPLQQWLNLHELKLAHHKGGEGFGERAVRIGSLSDLAVMFDPTGRTLREVAEAILARAEAHGAGAMLVGVGGPPMSGLAQFTVDLRTTLQALGWPIVDLMDLSSLMAVDDAKARQEGLWTGRPGGDWLVREVIAPLRAGGRVLVETLPEEVPGGFEPHLPLFLSEESLVLMMGERMFVPPIMDALAVSVLLEVSTHESTRRLYEIPESEPFDKKFVVQYLKREGGVYRDYLQAHQVEESATIRVSAEHPARFSVRHPGAA